MTSGERQARIVVWGVPGIVFLAVLGGLLFYQVSMRLRVAVQTATESVEDRVLRDVTDVDVVAAAIEGMSDVSAFEFRVDVAGVLDGISAVKTVMMTSFEDGTLGIADGLFAPPPGMDLDIETGTISRVEPWIPENVALLGRSLGTVVNDPPAPALGADVPIRQYVRTSEAFQEWFGQSLFVKRVIRVAPELDTDDPQTVNPLNIRGFLLARVDPSVEALAASEPWARVHVGTTHASARTSAPWRIEIPLSFSRVPLTGAMDASILPNRRELAFAALLATCGAVLASVGLASVSSRRRNLETLRKRLEIATAGAGIGVWGWDITAATTVFSPTYARMLGYKPGEFPLQVEAWQQLAHPDDLADAEAKLRKHLEGEEPIYHDELRLRTAHGHWIWFRAVGEVVARDDEGRPTRVIGVHIEIQELRRAIDDANEASRAKSDFLANMSHEIRTPMTANLGYADLLGNEFGNDPEQAADAIRTIRSNANHLLTVINDVPDVSKIEAGLMTTERIELDPIDLAADAIKLIRPRAAGKGITLDLAIDTPIPERIESDPTRLRQILLNLIGNAVKFTEVGSVIVRVSCDPEMESIRFAVTDTGIGMGPEQLDTVRRFEAFSQADESVTRKFGGTGLGLRISNALSILLGGRLDVDSEPGVGSTFSAIAATDELQAVTFLTPEEIDARFRRADDRDGHNGKHAASVKPLEGRRVLLAADGPDNQRLISFHLKKAGAEVIVCENGRIALERLQTASPDLILMDMQMPEMDGYTATRRLRATGHRLPVIALTAHAMEGDRQKCLSAGCDDYLTKPIDKALLIERCSGWVEREDARRAA